ncbi:FKBP-type peptidyl-prolyl cis-trans isomerase [Actinoplanes sp. HUAS TT8]|uniref:FKBP-type peptidyl-prolyl cis-trans isomerase n=1 Tax=Actinoplanes sp. HUAS TT8 TaxID=3447453 RepID=UPI003F523494
MPDSVTSRGPAAAKPAPASPSIRSGQPLKTKAEKRAEAKAAKARARAMERRRRALSVAGVAVVVLALLVGLVVWIGNSSSTTSAGSATTAGAEPSAAATEAAATEAAATEAAATEAAPTEAVFPPVPAGADPALSTKPKTTAGKGKITQLKTTTLIEGTGAAVAAGQTINVNYVGVTYADGKEFDSSWTRKEPFSFQVGAGNVIKGWDQGLIGAKVGSRVQLDIPAALAYGEHPAGGQPAGTLRFIVDVLSAA